MREILVAGRALLTTDALARQLLLYARELSESGRSDVVDIPVGVDGAATTCALLIGGSTPLAAVALPGSEDGVLPGEDEALFELQRRSDDLRTVAPARILAQKDREPIS